MLSEFQISIGFTESAASAGIASYNAVLDIIQSWRISPTWSTMHGSHPGAIRLRSALRARSRFLSNLAPRLPIPEMKCPSASLR
jgi:hypothetical protein